MPPKGTNLAANLTGRREVAGVPAAASALQVRLTVWLILCGGLALRAIGLSDARLWTDEVYSATWAVQSASHLIIGDLRFDIHPPLYYLQLHLWALVSHSTLWLFMNSLAWSWLAVLALWNCARRFVAMPVALTATLLFAAMPVGVDWSHSLRMYGMLGCLAILAFFFCYRVFIAASFKRDGWLLGATLLTMTYSHVAGFMFFGYAGGYGVYLIAQHRPDRRRIVWWVKVNLLGGALALPAVLNSLLRDTNHFPRLPTPDVIAETLGSLIAGPAIHQQWAAGLAIAVGIFVAVAFIAHANLRAVLIGFVATPIGFAIVMSYVLQPMWIDRSFLFTTPFLALAIAQGIVIASDGVARLVGAAGRHIAFGCVVGLLAAGLGWASVWAATHDLKPTNYRAAAREIRSGLRPGDVVFVPDDAAFWGIAGYLVGPDWGSPLTIQDPSNFSQKWVKILDWLGPVWRRRLDLEPRGRTLSYDGATLVVGISIPPLVADAKRVWLVNDASNRHPYITLPGFERERGDYHALTVQLMTRNPGF